MRVAITGPVFLAYPKIFCRLAQALIDNADEVYVFTLVTKKTGDRLLHQIQNLFISATVHSYVGIPPLAHVSELTTAYAIEHNIDLWIDKESETCRHLRSNGIVALQVPPEGGR